MGLAYRIKPGIFTGHFLKHLPNELRVLMQGNDVRRNEDDESVVHETCIWIDVHVDGVEFFENSREKSVSHLDPHFWDLITSFLITVP